MAPTISIRAPSFGPDMVSFKYGPMWLSIFRPKLYIRFMAARRSGSGVSAKVWKIHSIKTG